jgi:hypothetical protein
MTHIMGTTHPAADGLPPMRRCQRKVPDFIHSFFKTGRYQEFENKLLYKSSIDDRESRFVVCLVMIYLNYFMTMMS